MPPSLCCWQEAALQDESAALRVSWGRLAAREEQAEGREAAATALLDQAVVVERELAVMLALAGRCTAAVSPSPAPPALPFPVRRLLRCCPDPPGTRRQRAAAADGRGTHLMLLLHLSAAALI